MTKKQSQRRSARNAVAEDADGNVDKIRDILFGSQMREFEQRLEATEKRLAEAIERTAKDMERRIERLDKYARREVDKLSEQIKEERRNRAAEGKSSASELSGLAEQVESWFAEVDEQLAKESREFRNALHDQGEELMAQIREARGQLQDSLQKETAELKDDKLAREDMAALLTEVAMRLNKDFKLPKA